MARTYVVTGDPRYEDWFRRILAIRNGEAPRKQVRRPFGPIGWADAGSELRGDRPGLADMIDIFRRYPRVLTGQDSPKIEVIGDSEEQPNA